MPYLSILNVFPRLDSADFDLFPNASFDDYKSAGPQRRFISMAVEGLQTEHALIESNF